ncbi:MAG: VCBS repeat-containing protein [FCB group bacterium]|jgi:hypothetical protein|nr:VCBS repeat-containing protein [FCB group bacterium]
MLTLALAAILGAATVFVAEDVPQLDGDLEFSQQDMVWREWRNTDTDIDGDGTNDLIDDSLLYFLKNGHYSEKTSYPISAEEVAPVGQFWKRDLYLRYPDRLEVATWENGAWKKKSVQPVEWPQPDPSFRAPDPGDEPETNEDRAVRFSSFLHDIDGDGTPEIALAAEKGFCIYALGGERYEPSGVLKVYPPVRPVRVSQYYLNEDDGPQRAMRCGLTLSGATLTSVDFDFFSKDKARFNISRYSLKPGENEYTAEPLSQMTTEPMMQYMEPESLNSDETVDFVGRYFDDARSNPLRHAIQTVSVSTDGGKSIQTLRSTEIPYSNRKFADMDGDGDSDFVIQRTGIFDGGLRELVNRVFTDTTVKHRLDVHLQDGQGRFSAKPDFGWEGRLQLDRPPFKQSAMVNKYVRDGLIGLGDFNGDGRMDLAIQDKPERIAIRFATANGFEAKAASWVTTTAETDFVIADVDGDGRSDIVLMDFPAKPQARIFFSREAQP